MAKKYFIFRHGETYFSKNKVEYGEYELTAEILPQAKPVVKKLGKYLNSKSVDLFLSSEFFRCQQTSKIISGETEKDFKTEKLLNEYYKESFEKFNDRMKSLVDKLEKIDEEVVAICTHGAVVAALRYMLLQKEFSEDKLYDYPSPGVMIEISGSQKTQIDFNKDF